MIDTLIQDVRYAARRLRGSGGYTAIAVLTLALGIGANTAIFSVIDGVVLRPLAYDDSDRVVRVRGHERGGDDFGTVSYPNFRDLEERSTVFEAVAAQHGWQPIVTGDGEPERLQGASVTADYFRVLGIEPVHGRFFLESEDEPGGASTVVLGHGLWQRRFGGDPAVVGETVELGGVAYDVVGIAPDFEDPRLRDSRLELWRVSPAYFGSDDLSRTGRSFNVIARMRAGVGLDRAQAEVNTIMRGLEEAYPDANTGRGLRLVPLKEEIVGPMRPALLILLAATGLVLLIACANVANLQLSRSAARTREIAVRSALGAPRRRIARQLLTESTLLALLGGAVGVGLAFWATDLLVALGGPQLPRADAVGVDGRVLAFAAGASLLSGLLFGLAPAARASRTDLRTALTSGSRGGTGDRSRRRFRSALVAGEVALAMVVLVGAGLLVRSLSSLRQVDPGFRTAGVLTVHIEPALADRYEGDALTGLFDQLLERLAALPAVEAAGSIDILPTSGDFNGMSFTIDGRPEPARGETPMAQARAVMPGYFRAMGTPLVRGRAFDDRDGADSPPVVIVNEAMARRHWPDADPV
ncbi:MAG: ABC transporter permease, partial [Gemmatimonadota bacterium]